MKSLTLLSADLTRRGLIAGLAAFGVAGCQTIGKPSLAPPGFRIARFRVDAQPLRDLGGGYNADFLEKAVTDEAKIQFAPFLGGPPGNELTLQIGALQMPSLPDEVYELGFGSGYSSDYLDGIVIVKQGANITRTKFLTVSPSSSGGAWYLPGNVWRREKVLAQMYVGWVCREVFGRF